MFFFGTGSVDRDKVHMNQEHELYTVCVCVEKTNISRHVITKKESSLPTLPLFRYLVPWLHVISESLPLIFRILRQPGNPRVFTDFCGRHLALLMCLGVQ